MRLGLRREVAVMADYSGKRGKARLEGDPRTQTVQAGGGVQGYPWLHGNLVTSLGSVGLGVKTIHNQTNTSNSN